MKRLLPLLTVFCLLAAAASPLPAQIVGGEWFEHLDVHSLNAYAGLGSVLSPAGDRNADGVQDFLAGEPGIDACSLISGADGWVLVRWNTAYGYATRFGSSLAGDMNLDGDGVPDFIVGAPHTNFIGTAGGSVFVFPSSGNHYRIDGANGESFGTQVVALGDVTGDGLTDWAASSPFASPGGVFQAGSISVHSGYDGRALFQIDGTTMNGFLGVKLANAGDVNRDGMPDLLVANPEATLQGMGDVGIAELYSLATGTRLYRWEGADSSNFFGQALCGAGDVDRDGFLDLAIAAPDADWNNAYLAGVVYLYSGRTGALLRRMGGSGGKRFGSCLAPAGDLDEDGVPELAIGAIGHAGGSGALYVVNTGNEKKIQTFLGESGEVLGASAVIIDGLSPKPGLPGVVAGDPGATVAGILGCGRAHVFAFDPFLSADAGSVSSAVGGTVKLSLDFPAADAGRSYGLLLSLAGRGPSNLGGIQVPLSNDIYYQRARNGSYPSTFLNPTGTLDGNGAATITYTWTPGQLANKIGRTVWLAAVSHVGNTVYRSTAAVGIEVKS